MSLKKRRILVLMHPDLVPPQPGEERDERLLYHGKTEIDVVRTLGALGHQVRALGVQEDLAPIREAVRELRPHVVFNLLEEFHHLPHFDQHVVSYLELLKVRYTGCNPRGLVLARDKALSKKLAAWHRVHVPHFAVVPRGRGVARPRGLEFPLIVKSLMDEGSFGIAQASIVDSDEKLADRVRYLHGRDADAIVEQYIAGREIYVGVLGNRRLDVLPIWELTFENLPAGAMAIATARVKHDPDYQERRGIRQQRATEIAAGIEASIVRTTRRIYRILSLDGYARLDYRLREDGRLFFLEANPNPDIAQSQEFASAAEEAGLAYPALLERIVSLGLRRPVP